MSYIAAEDVAKAKEMDLLTYLRNYEPQELVHVSGNTYCTREHDSLRISNGKWCWFSKGIGGRSALDYLIKVKGISRRAECPQRHFTMSYKRISVRFNMDVDAERKAWEIIHEKGNGLVGKEVISAINTSSELSGLEKMIRKVVSEELKKAMFIPSEPAARSSDTEESENEILDFLETF